jgi:hypothetical protein
MSILPRQLWVARKYAKIITKLKMGRLLIHLHVKIMHLILVEQTQNMLLKIITCWASNFLKQRVGINLLHRDN